MNKPQIIQLDRPKHIRDYPNGPCYKAGTLVTTNADWRTERPIFNADKCNGCYYCYLCCPEGVISKNQSKIEIDFDFCKGCGICAKVCPRNAFEMVREDKTRSFTATSSQGLLYMAECLHYASGGRFPIVMMNANRSLALPWSIYGDHRDSLSLLDCGWIQVYTEDAQESLDMVIQAFAIAENLSVLTPVMINLDGFILTHTYEPVEIPDEEQVKAFLPAFNTPYKMNFEEPQNMGFSTSPSDNMEFKYQQHQAMLAAKKVIMQVDSRFEKEFGRGYGGMVHAYRCEDADYIIISLGSTSGTCKVVADELREEGFKAGVLKIRFMWPFPEEEIYKVTKHAKGIAVIDRDISFGYEGTVYTNVSSALSKYNSNITKLNYIAGLGGRDISKQDIREMFYGIKAASEGLEHDKITFINLGVEI